jgi:hypothetical protein
MIKRFILAAALTLLPLTAFAQTAICPAYSMHWKTVVSGTGTAYTPNVATDQCRMLVSTSSASVTVTLPKPTGIQWPNGTMFYWFTSGSGTATLTAATGTTVNGGSTLAKAQGVGATCFSNGAAWYCKP